MIRTKWVKRRLWLVAPFSDSRVTVGELTAASYVSTDSMLPDKQGLSVCRTLPQGAGNVPRYVAGDVLIGNIRPYLKKIWHADSSGGASPDVLIFHPNESVNDEFLFHRLSQDSFFDFMTGSSKGSKMPRGDKSAIEKYAISYPSSIDEQRRIAGILSTCDEVITRSRAAVEKLRKIKAGMLNDFFTRGIDDDGRLRPSPQRAPKLYKDSPLGPIPKEWEVETVDECFDLLRNNTFSRAMLVEQPGQIYNVHYGDVLVKYETIVDCARDRLPSLREDVSLGSSVDYAREGDLVFADTAEDDTVGKAIELVDVGGLKVVAGLHTIFMRSKIRRFASRWLGYFVNSAAFHSQLLPFVVGSKVSSISRGNIKRVSVLIPSGEEQCRVVERMASIDEEIRREEDLIAKYRSVKAGLMQRLLSPPGDAEVVDETILEAV